jgi:hypothetical protein
MDFCFLHGQQAEKEIIKMTGRKNRRNNIIVLYLDKTKVSKKYMKY